MLPPRGEINQGEVSTTRSMDSRTLPATANAPGFANTKKAPLRSASERGSNNRRQRAAQGSSKRSGAMRMRPSPEKATDERNTEMVG